jgi:hypothetical protein
VNPGSLLFCVIMTALAAASLKQGDPGFFVLCSLLALFESLKVFDDEPKDEPES